MTLLDLLDTKRPLVIAHRGASGDAPENTMAAFELALEQGADVLELDVHMTADGYPVVFHDDAVDRSTNGRGLLRHMTLAEVKRLDAGSWFDSRFSGQRVLTLEEVVQWAKGKVPLAIEIKNTPYQYRGIEAAVTGVLERAGALADHEVFSFDRACVRRFKAREPALLTGICHTGEASSPLSLATEAGATILHPGLAAVHPDAVRDVHAAGMLVFPWVANTPEEVQRLATLGVDGITTDRPGLVRRIVSG